MKSSIPPGYHPLDDLNDTINNNRKLYRAWKRTRRNNLKANRKKAHFRKFMKALDRYFPKHTSSGGISPLKLD